MKNLTEKIEQVLKIGFPLAVGLGYLYYLIFYWRFHIPIFSFLEIEEVLNIFIIFCLLILIIFVAVFFFLEFIINKKNTTPAATTSTIKEHIKNYSLFNIFWLGYILMSFLNNKSEVMEGWNYSRWLIIWQLILFFSGNILNYLLIEMRKRKLSDGWRYSSFLVQISIILVFFAFTNAEAIKSDRINFGTSIELNDDSTIKCDKFLLYVGNTKNYFFLYDLPKGEPIIYKMDDVKSIHLRNEQPK